MPHIPNLLSSQGVFYVIALKQNNVPEMLAKYANFLTGSIVLERWCGIEYLYVLKFQRIL
jgi:release factor glutamine methyltransferase